MKPDILGLVEQIYNDQLDWRRHLHRHPELSGEESNTTVYIRELLEKFGLKIRRLKMPTGVLAELKGKHPGPIIAVRSDIDALPVFERTGLPFASAIEGCMHACGHDIHMAVVLGVAAVMVGLREHLHGTVRFLFQPAEEMPPGGAVEMINEGALDNVSMLLGLHNDPRTDVGKISLRDGPTMAAVTDFDLTVTGRTGHVARPHECIDALPVACEIVESLQKIVSREIDPLSTAAIGFGQIEGGRARNTVAEEIRLCGTARTLDPKLVEKIPKLIKRTVEAIARAHSAKVRMDIVGRYPILINDARINTLLKRNYAELFSVKDVETTELVLGGEDFARYLEHVPGAMFRLGIRNKKIGADKPWHSSRFMADERSLFYGTALICATLLDTLGQENK
ncbi:MAG TPA: M20 family metallopeptidase [candidate division Zixibacteria bacterium]|nr:M20 family metallopeptidase [candidate division Zixibacteria bacterium]